MKKILIYSDKIKSGKTTNLFRWVAGKKSIGGILQPVVNNKRYIYSITDKSLIQLEISENQSKNFTEDLIIKIGKYIFLKSAFDKAKEILSRDINKNLDWLIIDEIGPLELEGKGLEPLVGRIINQIDELDSFVILVVRDSLLNAVLEKYELHNKYDFWPPVDKEF